ncbi:MAG: putative Ig domain-containing protein, partial [Sedimenticola sp.]
GVAPAGITIDGTTGVLSWTPTAGQEGYHEVQVFAVDQDNSVAQQEFVVQVLAENQPPTITSTPVTTVMQGLPYSYQVVATDSEDTELTYSLISSPSTMSIDATSGLISWNPQSTDVGSHPIVIRVSDSLDAYVVQSYTLAVNDTPNPGNHPPEINSTPSGSAVVGQQYQYALLVNDPDYDPLNITLAVAPEGMQLNGATHIASWTPTEAQVGSHEVSLQVSDGNFIITQTFTITVHGRIGNDPPVIEGSPGHVVRVGENYVYQVVASDVDGDALTYSLEQSPAGMNMNVMGLVTWTPVSADIGVHTVAVGVSDGQALVTQTYSLTVVGSGVPVINSTPTTQVNAGDTYSYLVTATDPDNNLITLSLVQAPAGMGLNGSNGQITWQTDEQDLGVHEIILQVEDDGGLSSQQIFRLEVIQPNVAPDITSAPVFTGVVDFEYRYQLTAVDANGDTLAYSLISPPNGMTIDQTGLISWTPGSVQAGNHAIVSRVSDGQYYTQQSYTLEVSSEALPLTVDIAITQQTINIGDTVHITVSTSGGVGQATKTLSVDGNNLALDESGNADYVTTRGGRHEVVVTTDDGNSTTTSNTYFTVIDPSDTTPPEVSLTSPGHESTISTLTNVMGTVQDTNLTNVMLVYKRVDSNQYVELYKGVDSFNAETIAQFDPSMLVNGIYNIILQAEDAGGNVGFDSVTVTVEGDLKVGNFSFTVTDLEIPVAGIPIRVNRTYDSRRRAEKLDFGYGWSVDYQNVRVEESRTPGKYWALNSYRYGPLNALTRFCVEPQGSPTVTVTLPDGKQESFEVAASPSCAEMTVVLDVELDFKPVGDTQSKLVALNDSSGRLVNGHLVETGYFSYPLDPGRYQLTTREGYIYTLDQDFGVTQITTPNGQTLSYSDAGIIHSGGKSVLFNRDAEGKITSITDPMGNTLEYPYSSIDDLVAATDQADATTSYTYNNNHGLLDIIDPLGRTLLKNIYDDDGRLIAQEDGNGNRTEFNHDIEGRFSLVTDRNGHNTQFYYDDEGNVLTQIDHLGNTTSFIYDERGNQLSKTDTLGSVSGATYNASNDQLTQADALGNTVSFEYNTRGQETLITDARGNSYTNTYDSVGNLLTVTDPDGNIAGNNINAQGLPSSTVDALGNSTSFTYDSDGNKLTETDAEGNVTSYSYDANGNVLTESRTRNIAGVDITETTTHEYDGRNRLITTTDALVGNVTGTEYDLSGHEIAKTDPQGNRTEMDYDLYGRLLETRYPDGAFETKSYGPEGNLLTETDRNGNTTT